MTLAITLDGRPLAEAPAIPEQTTVELAALPPEGAALRLEVGGIALEPFLRPGDPAWRWRWAAPGAAGSFAVLLRAEWPDGRTATLREQIVVSPRKLDQERYELLLADLQQLGRALVFALQGGANPAALPRESEPSAPTAAEELYGLFGSELERLAAAVTRLSRRPPDRLRPGVDEVALGQLQDAGAVVAIRPELDLAQLAVPTPSYDSYEARLLKRLLNTLKHRLERLAANPLPPVLSERVEGARAQLRALRALPFLSAVPALTSYRGPTPRLQRDPEYRVVYGVWRALRRRPLISWDEATLAIPVAELPRLYERWCAATVASSLLGLPGYSVAAQAILGPDDEPLLSLPEDEPLLTLAGPDGGAIRLRYQPRYGPRSRGEACADSFASLDRHTRVPDLALEISRPHALPAIALLDAKYRLDASGGVPEDALADAYSYLGSIGVAGQRATCGAALLYPGHGSAERYPSGVAALPLLPGATAALAAWLADVLA